jgi:hypothetical protein
VGSFETANHPGKENMRERQLFSFLFLYFESSCSADGIIVLYVGTFHPTSLTG